MNADRQALTDVLDEHFVMWHDLDGDGPPGEWRCACGLKFGFSHSAVDHVAEQITAHLAARLSDPDVVEAAEVGWYVGCGWDVEEVEVGQEATLTAARAALAAAADALGARP